MYEQRLQQKHEDIQEDLIKQRYTEEMEQLKVCFKIIFKIPIFCSKRIYKVKENPNNKN